MAKQRDDESVNRARGDLEALRSQDDVFTGPFASIVRRTKSYFGESETGADRIEIWGTRIGRTLSVAGFVFISIYLFVTYVR